MKMKKLISMAAALAMACTVMADPVFSGGVTSYAADSTDKVASYSYEITPILAPFNEYFFVKTDNPDPHSFRFADKNSVYADEGEEASIILYEDTFSNNDLFADVVYENEETKRVNGGYIFESFNTDGGNIVLQEVTERDYWGDPVKWEDTDIKLTLPKLCDDIDYLIDTYAKGDTFFEKMDAVQRGFESICLYSGSNIRGKLYKDSDFWCVTSFTHTDQSFYIFSPYEREGSQRLFASTIYPYRYDSLGFPSVMAIISKRLNADSSYKWDPYTHYLIEVTYNGETHTYGGAGEGEGQGLSKDKITRYFTFDDEEEITLEGSKELLDYYSQIKMDDDIPREDALTWEKIYNTVGDGAWANVSGGYAYFYKNDDENRFIEEEWGVGYSLYWGGSLGYASDVWIDGRYVGVDETFIPGVTFEDAPDKDIILTNTTIPVLDYDIDYEYNYDTGYYESVYKNVKVTENKGLLTYYYDENQNVWRASDYTKFYNVASKGLLDKKYLDMLELTLEEVEALDVDRNTYDVPTKGYKYNGSVAPGTPFNYEAGDINLDGDINMKDMAMMQNYLNDKDSMFIGRNIADTNHDNEVNLKDYAVLQQYLNGWNVKLK